MNLFLIFSLHLNVYDLDHLYPFPERKNDLKKLSHQLKDKNWNKLT